MRFLCFCGLFGTRFPLRSRLDAYLHNAPSWMMQLGDFLRRSGDAVALLVRASGVRQGVLMRVYMNTYVHTSALTLVNRNTNRIIA